MRGHRCGDATTTAKARWTAARNSSPRPGVASSYSSAALFNSALAARRIRFRLSTGLAGTTLGDLCFDVGPLNDVGRPCVDLVAPAAYLIEPCLLNVLASKIAPQAGG